MQRATISHWRQQLCMDSSNAEPTAVDSSNFSNSYHCAV